MMIDTKSCLRLLATTTLLLALTAPTLAKAQTAFPFNITRDAKGAVSRIDLPSRTSVMMDDQDDTLYELKTSLAAYQASANGASLAATAQDEIVPESKDDKKLYQEAKEILKHDISVSTLEDAKLTKEFATAKSKLFKIELFRLLAAPNTPSAFDRDKLIAEAVKQVMSGAKQVLVLPSVYDVFEFLVSQYIESLESRREFFQNQLLIELAYDKTIFTEKEKSAIRSSVLYSQLAIENIPAREKARKVWSTYGDTQLAKRVAPCKDFASSKETSFGQCFKITGHELVNRMVKKSLTSNDVSLAFDSQKTTRVRDHRAVLLLAKFGLMLVPAPGFAKKPFTMWLNSQYQPQRKSEGFLYGHAVRKGLPTLADQILNNSSNPVIRK